MDALFTAQRDWEEKFLGSQKHSGKVGAFEGAMYEARGYYRPQVDCVMFTRDRVPFCAVCQQRPLRSHRPVRRKIRQVRRGRAVKTDLTGYAPCDNSRA